MTSNTLSEGTSGELRPVSGLEASLSVITSLKKNNEQGLIAIARGQKRKYSFVGCNENPRRESKMRKTWKDEVFIS